MQKLFVFFPSFLFMTLFCGHTMAKRAKVCLKGLSAQWIHDDKKRNLDVKHDMNRDGAMDLILWRKKVSPALQEKTYFLFAKKTDCFHYIGQVEAFSLRSIVFQSSRRQGYSDVLTRVRSFPKMDIFAGTTALSFFHKEQSYRFDGKIYKKTKQVKYYSQSFSGEHPVR